MPEIPNEYDKKFIIILSIVEYKLFKDVYIQVRN